MPCLPPRRPVLRGREGSRGSRPQVVDSDSEEEGRGGEGKREEGEPEVASPDRSQGGGAGLRKKSRRRSNGSSFTTFLQEAGETTKGFLDAMKARVVAPLHPP